MFPTSSHPSSSAPGDGLPTGPWACTRGDLARHADVRLVELVCEHVFAAGIDGDAAEETLNALRLSYWMGWYDRTGMWLSEQERDHFRTALALASAASPVPDRVLHQARLAAEGDASGLSVLADGN